MSDFISPNCLNVSVKLTPSGGTTKESWTFPTQEELANRKIIAIETFSDVDMTDDPENSGRFPPTTALFNKLFLTLYTSSVPASNDAGSTQQPGLFYDRIAFSSLRRVQNNDFNLSPIPSFSKEIFRIRPTFLVFTKCKVQCPGPPLAIADTFSGVFTFHYLDIDDDGAGWMPPGWIAHKK